MFKGQNLWHSGIAHTSHVQESVGSNPTWCWAFNSLLSESSQKYCLKTYHSCRCSTNYFPWQLLCQTILTNTALTKITVSLNNIVAFKIGFYRITITKSPIWRYFLCINTRTLRFKQRSHWQAMRYTLLSCRGILKNPTSLTNMKSLSSNFQFWPNTAQVFFGKNKSNEKSWLCNFRPHASMQLCCISR